MKILQYFYNFEDPQVFNEYMDNVKGIKGTDQVKCKSLNLLAKKIWKETFGYDSVSISPGSGPTSDWTSPLKNCLKAEYSNFAKKCRRRGGVFKCCFSG